MPKIDLQLDMKTKEVSVNDKPKAEIWAEIGYYITDPDTGEKTFIKLPYDTALDTMHKQEIRGNSQFSQLMSDGNALLDGLVAFGKQLEPGESSVVRSDQIKLTVRIARRAAPKSASIVSSAITFTRGE